MKSPIYLSFFITGLLAMASLTTSCDSEESSSIEGRWQLKEIVSDCDEVNITTVHTLIESGDGDCCIETARTDFSESIVLTFTSQLCQTINLEESGRGTFTSGDLEETETKPITYTANDTSIEICDQDNNCITYQIESERLVLELEVTTLTGTQCNRVLSYKK